MMRDKCFPVETDALNIEKLRTEFNIDVIANSD